ncbi:hypothetical protein K440DRAFT_619937 [Wilcoxina mikolae CBS 423.85]|nr:hypothetical protein K440DRAFT_619937 [Wilcoxina mikolae CBS 423.85]
MFLPLHQLSTTLIHSFIHLCLTPFACSASIHPSTNQPTQIMARSEIVCHTDLLPVLRHANNNSSSSLTLHSSFSQFGV